MAQHTAGPWEWIGGNQKHILNAAGRSSDGSEMDDASVVLMMSGAARRHVTPSNAAIIAASPDLYAALDNSNKLLALMYQELLALRATTDVPYCSFDVDVQRQAIENQAALQKAEGRA